MPWIALGLYVVYLSLAFGLRTALQIHRTGSSGFKGISGRPGSAEWLGGILFVAALVLGFAAPVLDGRLGHWAGAALAAMGIALTLYAQVAMGTSWRIGVDESERTDLVTDGPFAVVRNPFFAALLPTSLGLVLLVPNVAAVAGFVLLVIALELQTRAVEEPYLLRAHGRAYADYARRVGRFVPGLGRLRP